VGVNIMQPLCRVGESDRHINSKFDDIAVVGVLFTLNDFHHFSESISKQTPAKAFPPQFHTLKSTISPYIKSVTKQSVRFYILTTL